MKKIIRITESDLHNIIKKSVSKILREANWSNAITDPYDNDDNEWSDNDEVDLLHDQEKEKRLR